MATCKDCLHYKACRRFNETRTSVIARSKGGAESLCEMYAHNSRFVEVVLCKDCKNYSDFDAHNHKRLKFHFCNKFGNITRESDFCSYGERKNNGTAQT